MPDLVGRLGSVDGLELGVWVSSAHVSVGPNPQRGLTLNSEQTQMLVILLASAIDLVEGCAEQEMDAAVPTPDQLPAKVERPPQPKAPRRTLTAQRLAARRHG